MDDEAVAASLLPPTPPPFDPQSDELFAQETVEATRLLNRVYNKAVTAAALFMNTENAEASAEEIDTAFSRFERM